MATPDSNLVRKIAGFLCAAPTDLSLPYPHGGVALGNVRGLEFRPTVKTKGITAQEFGGQVVEVVYLGESAVLGVVLRDYDPDALARVFPSCSTGPAGGPLVAQDVVGASRAGKLLSGSAVKLYVSPQAIDQDPGLYLPLACPLVDATARLRFAWSEEFSIPTIFQALPDATGRCYRMGLRSDLTL